MKRIKNIFTCSTVVFCFMHSGSGFAEVVNTVYDNSRGKLTIFYSAQEVLDIVEIVNTIQREIRSIPNSKNKQDRIYIHRSLYPHIVVYVWDCSKVAAKEYFWNRSKTLKACKKDIAMVQNEMNRLQRAFLNHNQIRTEINELKQDRWMNHTSLLNNEEAIEEQQLVYDHLAKIHDLLNSFASEYNYKTVYGILQKTIKQFTTFINKTKNIRELNNTDDHADLNEIFALSDDLKNISDIQNEQDLNVFLSSMQFLLTDHNIDNEKLLIAIQNIVDKGDSTGGFTMIMSFVGDLKDAHHVKIQGLKETNEYLTREKQKIRQNLDTTHSRLFSVWFPIIKKWNPPNTTYFQKISTMLSFYPLPITFELKATDRYQRSPSTGGAFVGSNYCEEYGKNMMQFNRRCLIP